jgi:hypothetical protein
MRGPFIISVLLHAGVIGATLVVLPGRTFAPVELPPVLPVELLRIADETNIRPSIATTEEREEQAVTPPAEEAEPEPRPRMAARPPLPAREPEPVPTEPGPTVVPERAPERQPERADPPQRTAEARPRPRPTPQQQRRQEPDFFDRMSALLDRTPQPERERPHVPFEEEERRDTQQAQSDTTRLGAGFQSDLTLSDVDALRVQIEKCWNVPAGVPNPEDLVVSIRVHLSPDGSVAQSPEILDRMRYNLGTDPFFRAMADSAVRAILRCQPYTMPADKYDAWRTLRVDFDPRFMLGGR